MKFEKMDPKTFSKICADLFNCSNGEIFIAWCRKNLEVDSYDAINPHNTSRNEGRRSTFRDIIGYYERGMDPQSYPEEAKR